MKRRCLVAVLWCSATLALCYAKEAPEAAAPTIPDGMRFVRDVYYGRVSGAQQLDLLLPPGETRPRPAIVYIHGGGWYLGDKGGASTFQFLRRFAEAGYVTASINYRLSDEAHFPASVEDCKLALRYLRAHAAEYGIETTRVGVIGCSAGGHLSAMLAVTRPEDGLDGAGEYPNESSAVQAAVLICPVTDPSVPFIIPPGEGLDDAVIRYLGGPPADQVAAAKRASPMTYVRIGLPPILAVHGLADKRVDPRQSKDLVAALTKAGSPAELILVEGGKHGMGIAQSHDNLERIVKFFDQHLATTSEQPSQPPKETIERWQDAKFGLFVHWGPASLTGQELSWSRAGERRGLPPLPPGKVPVEEYDNLYHRFNPSAFNAEEWVRIARDAGMKYMVFTTKHHDGFCMFDSALTDYDIAATPYQRDIVGELAKACHEENFGLGFYYSVPDWHYPNYLLGDPALYIQYLHGQVEELCKNYGQVDVLWFDAGRKEPASTWDADRLLARIRALQPSILINNRIPGKTDFDTPEQVVGRLQLDRPWESCITLGQQWSWKPDDDLKSADECIRLLVRCVGGGGNMLLNVGPMPGGAIEPRAVERLQQIGAWLRSYGQAVYGTRGGPFAPSYWGASTRKNQTVYLHILDGWESSLQLPPITPKIVSSRVLTGGEVQITQTAAGVTISRTAPNTNPPVSIVELTLDSAAAAIPPQPAGLGMPKGTKATASNIRRNEPNYTADKAVDEDPMSRWATDDGVKQAWLEIHLPSPMTFDVLTMDEAFGARIQSFELKRKVGEEWQPFYAGTTVGRNWAGKFPAVTAQDLRIEISRANDGPTIRDIQFHCVTP